MEKKSIVRTVIFKKSGTGKFGDYHVFEVTFDNGDKGDYLSKNNPQTSFKEGTECDYIIEEKINGQYKNYSIKPVQQFVPGKGNPAYEHKRTALRCAVDLCCHGKIDKKEISDYSNSFMKFLS